MEHISDILLLDFLANKTPESVRSTIRNHLDQCSDCRERYTQYEQTWKILELLDLEEKGLETPRWPALRNPNESVFSEPARRLTARRWAPLQTAAAILLAVLLGHFLAKWSAAKNPEAWSQEMLEKIHIEELAPISSTGLAQPFLDSMETQESRITP